MSVILYVSVLLYVFRLCFFLFLSQAISFLTPLAVIFVVKIIQRTDKTEIKEACLGMYVLDP